MNAPHQRICVSCSGVFFHSCKTESGKRFRGLRCHPCAQKWKLSTLNYRRCPTCSKPTGSRSRKYCDEHRFEMMRERLANEPELRKQYSDRLKAVASDGFKRTQELHPNLFRNTGLLYGRKAAHIRNHIGRGILSGACLLCVAAADSAEPWTVGAFRASYPVHSGTRCIDLRDRRHRFGCAWEPVNRMVVFERDDWRCRHCGIETPKDLMGTMRRNEPTLDHILPMSLGGAHSYANTQLLCRRCNSVKGDRTQREPRLTDIQDTTMYRVVVASIDRNNKITTGMPVEVCGLGR